MTILRPLVRSRQLLVALLILLISPVGLPLAETIHPAKAQEGDDALDGAALTASTLTVNVELILDASGSMAEDVPGSELF